MFDNCLTSSVNLKQPQELLIGSYMKEQTTNVRNFLRNYKKFSAANAVIIIANHGKPEGVFMPYEKWEQSRNDKLPKRKKFTMEDLEKYCFDGGDPDLSQKIDEILYKNYKNKR